MDKLLQWQEKELERIKNQSNIELIEDALLSANGDDYDGCFTGRGAWSFEEVKKELSRRLIEINFIDKPIS